MQIIGIGNVGSSDKFRYNAELGVFNFSMAFNLTEKTTVWVEVAAWAKQGETLWQGVQSGWFKPGKPLLVTLDLVELGLREYQDKQYLNFKTRLLAWKFLPMPKEKSEGESAPESEEDPKDFSF